MSLDRAGRDMGCTTGATTKSVSIPKRPTDGVSRRTHASVMAWLAPSWEPVPEKPLVLVPTQIQYSRTGEDWTTYAQPRYGQRYGHFINKPERRGTPVPEKQIPDDWPKPAAVTQRLEGEACCHEGLAAAWSRFFPGVPSKDAKTYRYPAPLSKTFWSCYAEPVEDFVAAVAKLGKAVTLIESSRDTNDTTSARIREGVDNLHALTRTIRSTVSPEHGKFRQEWVSTSLLGGLAMMALLDLTEQHRILSCQTCGAFVVTKAYQAVYCSDRCRNTAQKRRHRARKKTERAHVAEASGY